MAVNVEVEQKKNENNASLIRRFTRRVQESGVLPKMRSIRYLRREASENIRKTKRLKSLQRKEEIEELIKLGKISQVRGRGRRR